MEQENLTKKSIFEKIDSTLFQYVDQLKANPFYIKVLEFIHSVPRENRPWVQRLLVFLIFFIPFILSSILLNRPWVQRLLVFLIFFIPFILSSILLWQNYKLKKDIEQKKEIYRLSKEILNQKRDIEEVKRDLMTVEPIRNKTDVDEKIRRILTQLKIPMQNLSTKSFNLQPLSSGPFMISVTLSFQKLTVVQFVDFLSALTGAEKMILKEVDIKKSPSDNLLGGELMVNLYSEEDAE